MRALISGQASTAVLFCDERVYSVTLDAPENRREREEWEILWLFADTTDVEQVECEDEPKVLQTLELAWEKDRSLQLIIILLDSKEDIELRLSAATCLDPFLENSSVREFVENRMYSAPLPSSADLAGAIHQCSESKLQFVTALLLALDEDQVAINQRVSAWEALPTSLFGGSAEKVAFHSDAVHFGAFRVFATERGRKSWAIVQLLNHPHFRGSATARAVFKEWAAPFHETATATEFKRAQDEQSVYVDIETEVHRSKRTIKPRQAFEQAEKQRAAIKILLTQGREEQALRYTKQLIINQRRTSDPEHIAKSLCDLAQFVKGLGSPELQLEFAKMAIAEAPSDSWSHATVADAYRALSDYPQAQDAYYNAGAFGDERSAMLGRAEVLKDIGQLADALTILDNCVRDFPSDVVGRNARASALANFGRFEEALAAYDAILKDWRDEPVTMAGRAQVLRDMGRSEEALKEFEYIVTLYPDDVISHHSRAETLRDLGRLEAARDTFAVLMKRFPLAAEMQLSFAKTLRDLSNFSEAINQYKAVTKQHPLNLYGYVGLADTYRKSGDLVNALLAYDEIISRAHHTGFARNGKASILALQGAYSDALKLLPTNLPATSSEWVSYHIRAMVYMHSGKLERAESALKWGLVENQWALQRQYFQTALATLRIRQKRYQDSIDLVDSIAHPSVEPIARVLKMHAHGELGEVSVVAQIYNDFRQSAAPSIIQLREALAKRYLVKKPILTMDDSLFRQECNSLLLAA